ncbi:DUF2877 domain-containing protein [Lachnoclostridium edouardi]|uniref:DUF2877 domain-containing protein n=1 Tax=Lachnoclostridium edouardi TaxID=1926283 RepID=UPI000C7D9D55|nr:DUF2877 domain-containing protein [Lachnoclostridium edouardi]
MWRGISLHNQIGEMLSQGPKYGKVHSVFRRTVNLTDEDENMISLVTRKMDYAPISILVDIDEFQDCKICAGEAVYFHEKRIIIGPRILDISHAEHYVLKRGVYKSSGDLLEKNLKYLESFIYANGPEAIYSFETAAFQMVVQRTRLVQKAFLEDDREQIIQAGKGLLGLGQGLTPSGDDVLMGIFLVLGLDNSPAKHLHSILEEIIKDSREETTDISYEGLYRASKGFYRSILSEAAEALARSKNIGEILRKVMAIGHSSGRDLLYGILTGYKILVEKEKDYAN